MATIDLSDIVNDPDLGECVLIKRSTGGKFAAGGWQDETVDVPAYGVINVADDEALAQVPEGDRVAGSLQFLTGQPVYQTQVDRGAGNDTPGVSDKVIWNGLEYRVQAVGPWQNRGFYSAILVRMRGA
jgi:hypothetical protein